MTASQVPMFVLQAGDLRLEPEHPRHAEEMFVVLSDPAIYEYENEPPPSVYALRGGYERRQSRLSPDGEEVWLNWVVRLGTGEAIGYVQATLRPDGQAAVAYEFNSRYWGRGLASQAQRAKMLELVEREQTRDIWAVLKPSLAAPAAARRPHNGLAGRARPAPGTGRRDADAPGGAARLILAGYFSATAFKLARPASKSLPIMESMLTNTLISLEM